MSGLSESFWSLKTKNCHNANFVITRGTGGCCYDNFLCRQWRQIWHYDDFRFSVMGGQNTFVINTLHWRHNDHDSVTNHQPHHCLLSRLFGCRSKKTSKLRVTGSCAGNSPGTGEFPVKMASNAENVSILWRHHGFLLSVSSHPLELWLYRNIRTLTKEIDMRQ